MLPLGVVVNKSLRLMHFKESFMDKLKAIESCYLIPGNCWPAELDFIYSTCKNRRSYLEVGVFCGKSLFIASMALSHGATVYLVDDLSDYKYFPSREWGQQVLEATLSSIRKHRPDIRINTSYINSSSTDAMRQMFIDGILVDTIYIDACHEYAECRADIEHAKALLNDGIIFGHDYSSRNPGVMDAVNDCFSNFKTISGTRFWVGQTYAMKYDD